MHANKSCIADLKKALSKMSKAGIGVHKYCMTTPILTALNVAKIESTLELITFYLAKSMLCNDSRARLFYTYVMNMNNSGKLMGHKNLTTRTHSIMCKTQYNIYDNCFQQCTGLLDK